MTKKNTQQKENAVGEAMGSGYYDREYNGLGGVCGGDPAVARSCSGCVEFQNQHLGDQID